MELSAITENARRLLREIPAGVTLVAAGKSRTPAELAAAAEGGVVAIGHNYVQEAQRSVAALGARVRWHLIGHLQRNKAKLAAGLFDCVETIDSVRLGEALERAAAAAGRVLPVLIEVNIDDEPGKSGARPEEVPALARALASLSHLRLEGLMTMGRLADDPEESRGSFRRARALFEELRRASVPGAAMRCLSMGMSGSYRVAIEEGATEVRIGTALFGSR
ncbi:MAG: YggS family pyridoxal phosphate-dependent enzyme [Myxococcales bacterium]|nr:YggS family pyridoxal phosphate-dependent enzyme [Myxococcales bacterium]